MPIIVWEATRFPWAWATSPSQGRGESGQGKHSVAQATGATKGSANGAQKARMGPPPGLPRLRAQETVVQARTVTVNKFWTQNVLVNALLATGAGLGRLILRSILVGASRTTAPLEVPRLRL